MQGTAEMAARLDRAAELIATTGRVVAFTGAGVSTESGIPDFRSPTGLWARYDPEDFSFPNFMRSDAARRRYWAVGRELYAAIRAAQPNPAHQALVTLERLGLLDCVITQNVDDLHRRGGLPPEAVVELHGNVGRCLVTSRHPDSGVRDLATLDMLADYRGEMEATERLPFGVWGCVVESGLVRVGDDVVV